MLVAVVIAFAGPVLDSCGNPCGLKLGNLGEGLGFDHRHVRAKAARGHNRTAERRVDVNDRGERPVDPNRPRLGRHDAGNAARRGQVIDRCQSQGVGHLGSDRQAHPAALQIGGDQQRHGGASLQRVDKTGLIVQIGRKIAGDPGGPQRRQPRQFAGVVAHGVKHEQLPDFLRRRQPGFGRSHPCNRRIIQIERRNPQNIGAGHSVPLGGNHRALARSRPGSGSFAKRCAGRNQHRDHCLNHIRNGSYSVDMSQDFGGGYRNRTGLHGFAIRYVTSPPTRRRRSALSLATGAGHGKGRHRS